MPGELYDWIGELTSYALEFGDEAHTISHRGKNSKELIAGLKLNRRGSSVNIYGTPYSRFLQVNYPFRISNHLQVTEEEINEHIQQVNTGLETTREDIERSIREQKLKQISDEDITGAIESAKDEIRNVDSTIDWLYSDDNQNDWDGFRVQTRIYPGTDDFTIRNYDDAVSQVISDGRPVAVAIYDELEELGEEAVPKEQDTERTQPDRMFE